MSGNYPGNPYNLGPNGSYPPPGGQYPPPGAYPPPGGPGGMPPGMYPPPHGNMYPGGMMHPQQISSQPHYYAPPSNYQTTTYSAPPQKSNYNFLDPIIPTEKAQSVAQNLLAPQSGKITEVYKKLYIGKIPGDVKDNLIERLLKACGPIDSWKRAIDAGGNPKSFGYVEYDDIEGAVVCFKTLNGLKVGSNNLMVSPPILE